MSLDALAALAAVTPESFRIPDLCRVGRIYVELGDEGAKTLRYLIEESGHSAVRISKACHDAGHPVSHNIISVHRRKNCRCPA